MAAIGVTRSDTPSSRDSSLSLGALDARQDEAVPGEGGLHRLLNRPSALDRLVGDAGPLGKFRTDEPDRMPSGTSALTLKVGDALNRLAARLGLPGERILSGNAPIRAETLPLAPTELPPGGRSHPVGQGISPDAAKPAEATNSDNRAGHVDRGNHAAAGA